MANLNKVMLMGNLTRDPMLKFLNSGNGVCEFGMAINRTWMDAKTNEKKEDTTFVDCVLYGRQAETFQKFMSKGKPIFVEGRLNYRAWEKDGVKRSKLEVVVDNFQFIGARQEGGPGRGSEAQRGDGGHSAAPMDEAPRSAPQYDDEVPF